MQKVYFIKDISSDSLVRIFDVLGVNLKGNVGVKISTGEVDNNNYLQPKLIEKLVKRVNGTIIECNTAYEGKRHETSCHRELIHEHGFDAIAKVDIMDEDGFMGIPVKESVHLHNVNFVGNHFKNYDSMLVLSHFKGHPMGGFGGALKNMAIGIASSQGKAWIHTAGQVLDRKQLWDKLPSNDIFLESMAEAVEGVLDYIGKENVVYISVANNLSVDCDCISHPEEVKMEDIGIFASLDPVALDQACYDAIINSSDPGRFDLIERMNSRNGIHTVEEAARLGIGSRDYELIKI